MIFNKREVLALLGAKCQFFVTKINAIHFAQV